MKKRSESEQIIIDYLIKLERQFKVNVKWVRYDGAREFDTNELNKFYNKKGINTQPTIRYQHQTNGKAERMIRSIITTARCFLKTK